MKHSRALLSLVILTSCMQHTILLGAAEGSSEIPTTAESSEFHVVPNLEEILTNGFIDQIKSLTDELEAQISQAGAKNVRETLHQLHKILKKIRNAYSESNPSDKEKEKL